MKFGYKAKAMFSGAVDFREPCAKIAPNERKKLEELIDYFPYIHYNEINLIGL